MTTGSVCFYLQNRLIQTSQTGGQLYSDTSPFSIPWNNLLETLAAWGLQYKTLYSRNCCRIIIKSECFPLPTLANYTEAGVFGYDGHFQPVLQNNLQNKFTQQTVSFLLR